MPNPESLPPTPLSSSIERDAVWSKWTFFITQVGQKPGAIRQCSHCCRGEQGQNWPKSCQVLLGIATSEDTFNICIAFPIIPPFLIKWMDSMKNVNVLDKPHHFWWHWWPRLALSLCLKHLTAIPCYLLAAPIDSRPASARFPSVKPCHRPQTQQVLPLYEYDYINII